MKSLSISKETKRLVFRGTTLFHPDNFSCESSLFIRCALILSITGIPASAYLRLSACIGSLMVLHHVRRFSRRTPRPVGRRSLLPCSGRQLSGKAADSYYSSSSSFSYYFINYTDSIKISQVSNSLSFRRIIPLDKSTVFRYPQLSKNGQNIRNPNPF